MEEEELLTGTNNRIYVDIGKQLNEIHARPTKSVLVRRWTHFRLETRCYVIEKELGINLIYKRVQRNETDPTNHLIFCSFHSGLALFFFFFISVNINYY